MSGRSISFPYIRSLKARVKRTPEHVAKKFSLSNPELLSGITIETRWKRKLHRKLRDFTSEQFTHLRRHEKNRDTRVEINKKLKVIYALLSGKLDAKLGVCDETKSLIKEQLLIGLENCTQGYLNRLSTIVQDVAYAVSNFDELLFILRHDLVDKTARLETDEVHAHHRFFYVARDAMEFGVLAREDTYRGRISDADITTELEAAIEQLMNPINFVEKVCEQITIKLNQLGYAGNRQDGYEPEIYSSMAIEIAKLLGYRSLLADGVSINDYFITNDDVASVHDINWSRVKRDVYKKLLLDKYAVSYQGGERLSASAISSQLEYILNFGSDKEVADYFAETGPYQFAEETEIVRGFKSLSAQRQIEIIPFLPSMYWIGGLREVFQSYLVKMIRQEIPIENLIQRFLELRECRWSNLLRKFLTMGFIYNSVENNTVFSVLALKQPEITPVILEAILLIKDIPQRDELLEHVLLQQNSDGRNALMYVAAFYPVAVQQILAALDSISDPLQKKRVLEKILTQVDNRGLNVFMLTVCYDSEAVPCILALTKTIQDPVIKDRVLEDMLTQLSANQGNALMLAACQYPESVPKILSALSLISNADRRDEVVEKMLMQQCRNDYNALMFAAHYHADIIRDILETANSISNPAKKNELLENILAPQGIMHWNPLMLAVTFSSSVEAALQIFAVACSIADSAQRSRVLARILTMHNKMGWNVLTIAICKHFEIVPKIIDTVTSINDGGLRNKLLDRMLTQSTDTGENALMFAAQFHPRLVPTIIDAAKSINDHGLRDIVLARMLLQVAHYGENALMIALRNYLESVPVILDAFDAISNRREMSRVLEQVLIQSNSKNQNALNMAAWYHPDFVKLIKAKASSIIDLDQRRRLFHRALSQKNDDGLNVAMIAKNYNPDLVPIVDEMSLWALPMEKFYPKLLESEETNMIYRRVASSRKQEVFTRYLTIKKSRFCFPFQAMGHAIRLRIAKAVADNPAADVRDALQHVNPRSRFAHLLRMTGVDSTGGVEESNTISIV